MQCWVVCDAPLKDDTNRIRLLTLPRGALVTPTGHERAMPYNGKLVDYTEVLYFDGYNGTQGWIYTGYIEKYFEDFSSDVVKIKNATPNSNDGAQYLVWRGTTQYNLCGEMCVAYCAGWDLDVEAFLEAWSMKALSRFKQIFFENKSRGTGLEDLDSMLSVFEGYELPALRLSKHFFDDVAKLTLVTPGKMLALLSFHKVIISVHIDTRFGNLQPNGALHWVVIDRISPDGIGRGFVDIYNPFPNRKQRYSWNELMESAGNIYGIAIERVE